MIIRIVIAAVLAAAIVAFPSGLCQSLGKKFNTREPRTCPSRKEPTRGAISASQAALYVQCREEQPVSDLEVGLVENIKVEVGKPRPYLRLSDMRPTDIDPSQPVYPLRGSYTHYRCQGSPPKNCTSYDLVNASGLCWKTSFGDWSCALSGSSLVNYKFHVPGPGAR